MSRSWLYGAAQESNLPSLGLPDLTGPEDLPGTVRPRTEAGFSPASLVEQHVFNTLDDGRIATLDLLWSGFLLDAVYAATGGDP